MMMKPVSLFLTTVIATAWVSLAAPYSVDLFQQDSERTCLNKDDCVQELDTGISQGYPYSASDVNSHIAEESLGTHTSAFAGSASSSTSSAFGHFTTSAYEDEPESTEYPAGYPHNSMTNDCGSSSMPHLTMTGTRTMTATDMNSYPASMTYASTTGYWYTSSYVAYPTPTASRGATDEPTWPTYTVVAETPAATSSSFKSYASYATASAYPTSFHTDHWVVSATNMVASASTWTPQSTNSVTGAHANRPVYPPMV
ncbi:hypothetical protein BASA50_003563 [Batrachochytrium salamandrivorans]|uniref:Uncharacterized protein n=1 Tax=Batrachochytrium salamandrivorans TaxID=1357716 RepID=A0ABQ8FIZ9_9FUNG|nr:hypothetical protein BASA60_008205 [Batrachochytrium salamandrivorans]KAH6598524.1 hypothetical protein BASA50_003563 [Batrachochytrium salamandrivorans]